MHKHLLILLYINTHICIYTHIDCMPTSVSTLAQSQLLGSACDIYSSFIHMTVHIDSIAVNKKKMILRRIRIYTYVHTNI